jgi:Secretion system C-terminal sorting domain
VFRINDPRDFTCDNFLQPNISIVNLGKDTLRTAKLHYNIDGGIVKTLDWSGALARKQGASVTLPGQVLSPGYHKISSFSSDPNGVADQNPNNDTTALQFQVKQAMNALVTEGFEGLKFPPDQWSMKIPGDSINWARNNQSSFTGIASVYFNNFHNDSTGKANDLISPLVKYTDVDSVFISFRLAAATRNYPGSTDIPMDTLEVLVSDDCGINFTSVYKKWGIELQTVNRPNNSYPTEFSPGSPADWRKETINISELLGRTNNFVVAFRNISNAQNNIYIDDINLFTKTLAPNLKKNGYLISPNPFSNRFVIQNFPNASTLKAVEVFSAAGQLVFRRNWSLGTADSYIEVILNNQPGGIYIVKMIYSDKVVSERVMKANY